MRNGSDRTVAETRYPAPGEAPGSLHIDPAAPQPSVSVFAYGPDGQVEETIERVGEIEALVARWPVVWVNVDGLGDATVLRALAERFKLHRLALEDVVNLGQRAKAEPYADDLFVVARMPAEKLGQTEQISLFLGEGFVLTFQEHAGDCFDGVRTRLRQGKGKLRHSGADYLLYALLDAVVDAYFLPLEIVSEQLEVLEDEIFSRPTRATMETLHDLKRSLVLLRRAAAPHRELLNALLRETSPLIGRSTLVYLRDCYDHALRVQEILESYREMTSDLMNTYLSSISNRMNEVMKVLTIIATIFIPLGFVAGVYGMNFNPAASRWNMPELDWALGYPFALLLMGGFGAALLLVFWRKGWFR